LDFRYFLKGMLLPPFTQILLLLFAWKIRRRAPKTSWAICFVAIISLWILSTPVVASYLARTLEQNMALSSEQLEDIQADAIVILAGSQREYAPEFGEPVSGEVQLLRVRYGAFLQRKTGLPVLLSGGSVRGDEQRSLAETMAYDFEQGYKQKARWLEKNSRTTAENARYSYTILAAANKTDILLVTSSSHMMRAKWIFEQVGFNVFPSPTHFTDRDSLNINSFMPSAGSLELSSDVIHEWLGYMVYRFLE